LRDCFDSFQQLSSNACVGEARHDMHGLDLGPCRIKLGETNEDSIGFSDQQNTFAEPVDLHTVLTLIWWVGNNPSQAKRRAIFSKS
jgi:hypothetical protein